MFDCSSKYWCCRCHPKRWRSVRNRNVHNHLFACYCGELSSVWYTFVAFSSDQRCRTRMEKTVLVLRSEHRVFLFFLHMVLPNKCFDGVRCANVERRSTARSILQYYHGISPLLNSNLSRKTVCKIDISCRRTSHIQSVAF